MVAEFRGPPLHDLGITVTFDPSTGNELGFVNPIELEPPSAAGVEPAA
jgi:hypothetical protein